MNPSRYAKRPDTAALVARRVHDASRPAATRAMTAVYPACEVWEFLDRHAKRERSARAEAVTWNQSMIDTGFTQRRVPARST